MDLKPPLTKVIGDSSHSSISDSSMSVQRTVSPDPRWPSKFRWSVESPPPPPTSSIPCTVSTEKEISADSELLSTPPVPVASDGKADISYQLDVVDLVSNPLDSDETLTQKLGKTDSSGEDEPAAIGDGVSLPEIACQTEDSAGTNAPQMSPHQSTGLPSITIPSPEISVDPQVTFVPSIGAWAKPLAFAPPATPPSPATPSDLDPQHLNTLLDSFWPTLTDGLGQSQKKRNFPTTVKEFPRMPVQKVPVPELKDDGTLRFPWAARMDPSTRNLYRAAKPTFRLDGTPQVTIPSQVLHLGPENKKEYIIGQFHRCSLPPGGLIHAVVNRLWGRSCRIGCRKLSESTYMFHIPHDATRQWVTQRAVWHVDDCLLFVSSWKPVNSFKVPEVSTIPVWVILKNVPDSCYSRLGLSHVASGLGEPMQTHKPRLDPTCLGEAKLLVEVELDKPFPKQIALDDKQGNIFLVDVEYTWIPSVCGRCGHLGHKEKRCLLPVVPSVVETTSIEEPQGELGKVLTQSVVTSELELQAKNSEIDLVSAEEAQVEPSVQILESAIERDTDLHSQMSVEPKDLSTPANNFTHSKVHIANGSNSLFISSPLADTQSAPTETIIMEAIPSPVIVFETNLVPKDNSLASSHSPEHGSPFSNQIDYNEQDDGDGFMSDATANLTMSRGGRLIKPLQKFQDMEWKTVRGRGKQGRRGRGYYCPSS
ncbi:uncharacterized protein LOC117127885 [Brassica rapa]|uniref:uncharacterized protein LOC117127885 n=1 Tax=Brassica campestris TaxID=3711 RepID=UPI00142D6AE5|nr:uncharacterized protein LOC117127885 [Brassica rapa]